ncbi:receptor-type tyrosine-protein phosphatase eta [Tiliqua scincoides]|uniref:receptor-type tyrosine-protein phosphatase eta n=1 Tax=Tiliqua scincoides TaxID=71010 RepID=UPI0034617C93
MRRRLGLLLLSAWLLLCHGKIKVAALCDNECDLVNITATRNEIQVQLPSNSVIYNVTSANGTLADHLRDDTVFNSDPGTLYTLYFNISNGTCCKIITTEPSPVSDLQVVDVTTTRVTLSWENYDKVSSEYSYVVLYTQNGNLKNVTSRDKVVTIEGLDPGTLYNFSVSPQAGDNVTTGEPQINSTYTKPSPVSDLQVVNVTTTSVTLNWENADNASSEYSYVVLYTQNGNPKNVTSRDKVVTIDGLEPGTFYNFSVYPQAGDNHTTGDSRSNDTYTKPNPVDNIHIENINTTAVHLWWNTSDPNSGNYIYHIEIVRNGDTKKDTANTTSAVIGNLEPGTLYTFTIYPVVGGDKAQGDPANGTIYTKPSPVSDLQVIDVTTTRVTLSWENADNVSSEYSYVVLYTQNGNPKNVTSRDKVVTIDGLEPGTFYNFSVYPQAGDNHTTGDSRSKDTYTKPRPVSDLQVVNVNTTRVTLSWENVDNASSEYSYVVLYTQNQNPKNVTSRDKVVTIEELDPGTFYNFSVFPRAGDTTGEPEIISTYTKPSSVSGLQVVNVTTTGVTLSWENVDNASSEYSYIVLYTQNGNPKNVTFRDKVVIIEGLDPGTLYNFSVSPRAGDNDTAGEPEIISTYTIPSSVSNISIIEVSTTVVILSWRNPDAASHSYVYRIHTSGGNRTVNNTFSSHDATISELTPGTMYTFNIYSVAADKKTEGSPRDASITTDPESVGKLDCTLVFKKPELYLNWSRPAGRYDNFSMKICNENWTKVNYYTAEQQATTLTNLNYFTNYNVSIVTHSFMKKSIPREVTCLTSIGDPPPLTDSPVVVATTYNSLKVQFNSFDSSHGPLKAYAIIISKSPGINLNESLKYTYNDFMSKKADAYVAHVTDVNKRSSLSNSQHLDILVGSGSKTHGYINGQLEPLGSYRACVAGFTHIDFVKEPTELIDAETSYFSFSPISDVVTLPQNPAVITGAVCGCLLGAAAIAVVVGFIFWKKRRKRRRNNDVIFTPIESKLLKVENFESYYKKQKADSNCGFAEEYEDLRMVGVNQPKFAAELTENKAKNRYNNVLPYDISRVKLSVQNHPTNDYINANYMPGYNSKKEFIAAQGPLPNTVQDFWRMIWEKNIYTIVMLTKCVEQGRTKSEEYWPNKQSKNYGDITVAMTSEIVLPEWTIRDFSMEKSDSSESHPVRQFHFTAWPDHGVPEATDLLINFRHLVQDYMKQNPPTSPTLVHCSAGVGRTGTFIAIDRLIHQMEMENTVDVYGVVYDLRMHRSLMVQTEDQYIFLNQCVLDIIKSQKEKKADLIYQNTNAMAIYENFTPSPHIGKANGYHV